MWPAKAVLRRLSAAGPADCRSQATADAWFTIEFEELWLPEGLLLARRCTGERTFGSNSGTGLRSRRKECSQEFKRRRPEWIVPIGQELAGEGNGVRKKPQATEFEHRREFSSRCRTERACLHDPWLAHRLRQMRSLATSGTTTPFPETLLDSMELRRVLHPAAIGRHHSRIAAHSREHPHTCR